MVAHLFASFNRLRLAFHPRHTPTPAPADPPLDAPCPLTHPDVPLPAWVASDPLVLKYRSLLGCLPWHHFPERSTDHPWPGPLPQPRAPFAAAFLIKLHEGKRFMSELRTYLIKHPALVWWLGFHRVPDPSALHGFNVAKTVPTRRQLSRVLRTLPNSAAQFLLTATVQQLQATLTPEQQASFGDVIAGDTQALLAWVKENNPKQFIREGRLDKNCQPAGDPDCKLGIKRRHNQAPAETEDDDFPTPSTDAKVVGELKVGVDIFWGYSSGIVATRLPNGTEVVLAERTRPFNEADPSYFLPLMEQVEQRLGRPPRFGAWDAAFDAHYVYTYFHKAGGFAAVPFGARGQGLGKEPRQFSAAGNPLCAAGLEMAFQFTYWDRSLTLVPHERAKYRCPLLFPESNGERCPIDDPRFTKKGCVATLAYPGARLRHQVERESEGYKKIYAQRTMVERINSQAEALEILHPKLRRGSAIVNRNTLTYVLINLRALQRIRRAAEEVRPAKTV